MKKFKTLDKALEFLSDRGYVVSRPTLFRHRKAGKLNATGDGTFLQSDVLQYADTFLAREQSDGEAVDVTRIQEKKLLADTRRATALATVAEAKAKEADVSFIPRQEYEEDLAKRALFLKSDLQNFVYKIVPELTTILDGAEEHISDGIQYAIKELEIYLGRYAESRGKKNG